MTRPHHGSPRLTVGMLVVLWALALGGGGVRAQDQSPQTAAPPTAVREVAPEIFYLQDDAGSLVPVPGFRYADFVDLLRLREGLPGLPEPPAVVLDGLSVVAAMPAMESRDRTRARVTVELTVRQLRPGWTSLPVGLPRLVLETEPEYSGTGRMVLVPDHAPAGAGRPAAGDFADDPKQGFRLWVESAAVASADAADAADGLHRIRLVGSLPIDVSQRSETLGVVLPAAVSSRLVVESPRADPAVSVEPVMLAFTARPRDDAEGSRVVIQGAVGQTRVRIQDRAAVSGIGPLLPEAVADTIVKVDGRTAVIETAVRLEGLANGEADVRIALPPKTTLREVRPPAQLRRVEGPPDAGVAIISIERSPDGRADLELECERSVDASGRQPFDIGGFGVEGIPAWRQWGRMSLLVEGDWQVDWEQPPGIRRIDPPPSARRPGLVASFAYDVQPVTLALRVRPRSSRMVVEPEYRYHVAATRVELNARLRISTRGAPVSRLVVAHEDWQIEEVGPPGIVDATGLVSEGGTLSIPFVQPLSGDAVIEMRCSRPLERAATEVSWQMPVPKADLVGPATVAISAESDIELIPDGAGMRGLTRQISPAVTRIAGDATRLAYRVDGLESSFRASRRYLERRVDATILGEVTLGTAGIEVLEKLRFDVAHVPLEFVDLLVDRDTPPADSIEVRQDGNLLTPIDVLPRNDEAAAATVDGAAAGPSGTRLRFLLPVPLLGTGELQIRYRLPLPDVPDKTTVAIDVPLVLPDEVRVVRQAVLLSDADTLQTEVRSNDWKRDAGLAGNASGRTWVAVTARPVLELAVTTRPERETGLTVVESAWLETRLLPDLREDIFRYMVTPGGSRLAVTLPLRGQAEPDAPSTGVRWSVRLDGRPWSGKPDAAGVVVVELPAGPDSHLLEFERREPIPLPGWLDLPFVLQLEPPVFSPGTLTRRTYWDLMLLPHQEPLLQPRGWTMQTGWAWNLYRFVRVTPVSPKALATWLTSSAAASGGDATELPDDRADHQRRVALVPLAVEPFPQGGRRVLYCRAGVIDEAGIRIMPSWLILLMASGASLGIGLLLVYRPALRKPLPVVGLAAGVLAAAAIMPDPVLVFLQAASVGLALAGVAALLRHWLEPSAGVSRPLPTRQVTPADSVTMAARPPSVIINTPEATAAPPEAGRGGLDRARA